LLMYMEFVVPPFHLTLSLQSLTIATAIQPLPSSIVIKDIQWDTIPLIMASATSMEIAL
jgi:hypothetical protein